jgi:GNAT superfamily N-acetyltransferase
MRLLARWLVRRLTRRPPPPLPSEQLDEDFVVPPEIAPHLLRIQLDPLMATLRTFGRGRPGITRETEIYWVVRDRRGRVIGGAKADANVPRAIALDVEIAPAHRRQGHASRLYEAIAATGIDVEAASDYSLEQRLMTPLGYAFQVGRRHKQQAE